MQRLSWGLFFKTIGPLFFLFFAWISSQFPADSKALLTLGITLWIAIWWMSECIPVAISALLPLILFPTLNIITFKEASAEYSNETILMFLGGFIIAKMLEHYGLHRLFANQMLNTFQLSKKSTILFWMGLASFISMWISNTSTAVMMIPLALAILENERDEGFKKALILGIVYACSIGGMATLVGTPTNAIFKGMSEELLGSTVNFWTWMKVGLPISIVLLFICWVLLILVFKVENGKTENIHVKTYRISTNQRNVLILFGILVVGWISGSLWWYGYLKGMNDTILVLAVVVLAFLIPNEEGKGSLCTWDLAKNIHWEVLLLFGGGLALAQGIQKSGLATKVVSILNGVNTMPIFISLFILFTIIVILSEIASNVATASIILPIVAIMELPTGIDREQLMIGATLMASVGFALPIATAPNAIGFATETFHSKDMLKAGLLLDLICIIFLVLINTLL